jgi:hypothetical protein
MFSYIFKKRTACGVAYHIFGIQAQIPALSTRKKKAIQEHPEHQTISLCTNGTVSSRSPLRHRLLFLPPLQGCCQGVAAARGPPLPRARLQVQHGAPGHGGGIGAGREVPQGGRPHHRPDSRCRAPRRHPGGRQGWRRCAFRVPFLLPFHTRSGAAI